MLSKSLLFLAWVTPAAPGWITAPAHALQWVALCALSSNGDSVVELLFRATTILVSAMGVAECSRVFVVLGRLGLFDKPFSSRRSFLLALASLRETAAVRDALVLTAGGIVDGDPLDVPASPAVPAVPYRPAVAARAQVLGVARVPAVPAVYARAATSRSPAVVAVPGRPAVPAIRAVPALLASPAIPGVAAIPFVAGQALPAELLFLTLVPWLSFEDSSAPLPFEVLAGLLLLLGESGTHAVRANSSSDLRTSAELVRGGLCTFVRAATASDAILARHLPAYMTAMVLPAAFVGAGLSSAMVSDELLDAIIYETGTAPERDGVARRRMLHAGSVFPILGSILGLFRRASEAHSQIKRLQGRLTPSFTTGDMLDQWAALEPQLLLRAPFITQLLATCSCGVDLVDALVLDVESSEPGPSKVHTWAGGDEAGGSGGTLRDDALRRAFHQTEFRQTVDDAAGLEGVPLLEAAFLSRSVIVSRYLHMPVAWLRDRHQFFGQLAGFASYRVSYFARALTLDPLTDTVPELLQSYEWSDIQFDLWAASRFDHMDLVNAPGGYLAVKMLEDCSTYASVPCELHYRLESALRGAREFWVKLCTAAGYPSAPTTGVTIGAFFDDQISWVAQADGLPPQQKEEWLAWGETEFLGALRQAGVLRRERLTAAEPDRSFLEGFLPSDLPFFQRRAARRRDSIHLVTVRRAYPSLLPSTLLTIPGQQAYLPAKSAPSVAGALSSTSPSRPVSFADVDTDGGSPASKRPKAGPASAGLYMMLDPTHLFLAGWIYDLAAIAKFSKVKVDERCWSVLLSTKTNPLHLCPAPAQHGGASSKMHTAPAAFEAAGLSEIHRRFAVRASVAQAKRAGWTPHGGRSA